MLLMLVFHIQNWRDDEMMRSIEKSNAEKW